MLYLLNLLCPDRSNAMVLLDLALWGTSLLTGSALVNGYCRSGGYPRLRDLVILPYGLLVGVDFLAGWCMGLLIGVLAWQRLVGRDEGFLIALGLGVVFLAIQSRHLILVKAKGVSFLARVSILALTAAVHIIALQGGFINIATIRG